MCTALEKLEKQGIKKGIEQTQREAAVRMLKTGKYALEDIADVLGVSLEKVKKLREELNQ